MLGDKYPDNTILENDTNSYPRNLTLDEYAVARVQSELGDTSQERITGVIQGLIASLITRWPLGRTTALSGSGCSPGKCMTTT